MLRPYSSGHFTVKRIFSYGEGCVQISFFELLCHTIVFDNIAVLSLCRCCRALSCITDYCLLHRYIHTKFPYSTPNLIKLHRNFNAPIFVDELVQQSATRNFLSRADNCGEIIICGCLSRSEMALIYTPLLTSCRRLVELFT